MLNNNFKLCGNDIYCLHPVLCYFACTFTGCFMQETKNNKPLRNKKPSAAINVKTRNHLPQNFHYRLDEFLECWMNKTENHDADALPVGKLQV